VENRSPKSRRRVNSFLTNARQLRLKRRPTWFARHQKLLTIVGALIILLTFTIKEIVIGSLRDKIARLDSAEGTYDVQQQFHLVRELLERPKQSSTTGISSDENAGALYMYQYVSIGVEIQLLNDLSSHLENTSEETVALSDLGRCLGKRGIRWGAEDIGKAGHASSNEEARKLIDSIESGVYQEQQKLREIAKKQREDANSTMNSASVVSSLFYFAGWLLTFSRNLFGDRDVSFDT
jgi:hypothetical protein